MEADQAELIVALNRFSDRIDRLDRNSATSQVSINAGGVGVWVSVTCTAISFVMTMVLLVLYVEQSRKVDDLGDYLSAIYVAAPHLKPED